MRILILGGDGYLGWPTAMYLSARGHEVHLVDNYTRRRVHAESGTDSLTPIAAGLAERVTVWRDGDRHTITATEGDLTEWPCSGAGIPRLRPGHDHPLRPDPVRPVFHDGPAPVCIHPAKQRVSTLNVLWAMHYFAPCAHLVKLGTMGEYGTPNIDIEEGWIEISHNGRSDRLPFPKLPGSFYHCSKVHDSTNIEFACRVWGIAATDLNQGVVYGIETERDQAGSSTGHSVRLR